MGRIKIVAALLRQPSTGGHSGALGAFVPSYPADDDPPTGEAPTRAPWRQSDVKRAIAAAEQAGLGAYRVEIASDGTISIVVGELSDTPENTGDPGDRPGS